MTTATFTPDRTIPRPTSRRLGLALRAIRAYGTAAVDVVVLGRYAEEAGVRNPRPEYVGGPD
ncbi:hypothetical protein ACGFYP_16170 [Streptomyces sp. NPDC048370]|uniref:hypothetical protein n=1 Tax=Streptomyces sp. NPDC048370 TaxID=3365540 RepID=UPI0037194EAB